MKTLDLDAVHAFVLVADLQSFTRAAEVLDTTQSAISLKLKRLEAHLERRLLERTPRQVRLSVEGTAFLNSARDLLAAHDRAWSVLHAPPRRLRIGISDHVAGAALPSLLAKVNTHDPALIIEVRIAMSQEILALFDAGEVDAAFVLGHGERRDGEVLFSDEMDWFGLPDWPHETTLRIATLSSPCGLRSQATEALDAAGIAWQEVFVGGGVSAVAAAVTAGLAVAPLCARVAPAGSVSVRERLGLPRLRKSSVSVFRSVNDERSRSALKVMGAALKAG